MKWDDNYKFMVIISSCLSLFCTCNVLNLLELCGNVKISRFKSAYFDIANVDFYLKGQVSNLTGSHRN